MTALVSNAFRFPRRQVSKRTALLMSCASLALASTVAAPRNAYAQAFNGTMTSTGASQTSLGTGTETITVTAPTATIYWAATSNDFLPVSNTATFTSSSGITDYTVLNRVTPADASNPIQLNGHVISTLQGTSTIGGNIWFYSPSGIIVGSSATFDVGGLLLTSLTPTLTANDANGFSASFSKQTGDGGPIQILGGGPGYIHALQQNSYIALVAPRIEQGGTVKVDGSAAYVAATDLTMTMDQGLFNIQVDAGGGTDDINGIVHTGTTTGGTSSSLSSNHTIYMVAVPKNQALTMLLGGTVGYDSTVAGYSNGQIILTAGWSPYYETNGSLFFQTFDTSSDSNIIMGPGTYTSDVYARANTDVSAAATDGSIIFGGDLTLDSVFGTATLLATDGNSLTLNGSAYLFADSYQDSTGGDVTVEANSGGTVDIKGDLYMNANGTGTGGDVTIRADGGAVNVDGSVTAYADGSYGAAASSDSYAGDGYGGSINVVASNDGVLTTGSMFLSAGGVGQDAEDNLSGAGAGYGGDVLIDADSGGSIMVDGNLYVQTPGIGGNMLGTTPTGGDGHGGDVTVSAGDGSVEVTGNVNLYAEAWGGDVGDSGSGGTQTGGNAFGGYASIYSYGPGSITVGGSTDITANGFGGDAQTGGDAYGGTAKIYGYDGTIALGSSIYVSAQGFGGDASFGFGGVGGYGEGGYASIEARANPIVELLVPPAATITGGDAIVDASGTGGAGGAGNSDNPAGAGGDGVGGTDACVECSDGAYVLTQVDGATLSLGTVGVLAEGIGGAGGTGGTGQDGGMGGNGDGGTSRVALIDPYQTGATTGSMSFASLEIRARGLGGLGGDGGFGGDGGDGGDGQGGDVSLDVLAASLDAGEVELNAVGLGGAGGANTTGGAGGAGGTGFGGTIDLTIDGGGTLTTGDILLFALGRGGVGGNGTIGGDGGDGYGGDVSLTVIDGSMAAGNMEVVVRGRGGDGGGGCSCGAGGDGGYAEGGTNTLLIDATGSIDATTYVGYAN